VVTVRAERISVQSDGTEMIAAERPTQCSPTLRHRMRQEYQARGAWLARDKAGSASKLPGDNEGTLSMWAFFSRRLRMWLLLAIALPLTRALVHRLALAAERRDPSNRTAKALHQADSAVTVVSRRAASKAERRKAKR
jgi:hypothetical protein